MHVKQYLPDSQGATPTGMVPGTAARPHGQVRLTLWETGRRLHHPFFATSALRICKFSRQKLHYELPTQAFCGTRACHHDTFQATSSIGSAAVVDQIKVVNKEKSAGRGRRFLPATPPAQNSGSKPGAMRVFLISDIHTDYEENLEWIRNLSPTSFLNDALIVAGDVSDSIPIFEETFRILRPKFAHVFFTPGNHDLWLRTQASSISNLDSKPESKPDSKPDSIGISAPAPPSTGEVPGSGSAASEPTAKHPPEDSVSKLAVLFKICGELGVDTRPKFLKPSAGGAQKLEESGRGLESGEACSRERGAPSSKPDEVSTMGDRRAEQTGLLRGDEVAGSIQNDETGVESTGVNKHANGEVGSRSVLASSGVEPSLHSTRVEDQGAEGRNNPRAEFAKGEKISRETTSNPAQPQGREEVERYSARAQEQKSAGEKVEGRRQEAGAALFSTDPEQWLRSQSAGTGGEENGTKAGSNGMEAGDNGTREGKHEREGGVKETETGVNGTRNGKNETREGADVDLEGENGVGVSRCETGGDLRRRGEGVEAEEGSSGVWVVPILSWHHISFDTEPDIQGYNIPAIEKVAKDHKVCKWPPGWDARTESVARSFDAMNADLHWGFDPAAMPGSHVITFSHFLPRLELIPEKRFLFYPNLAKAVGSHALEARVRAIHAAAGSAPGCHLFGHTHFSWDMTLEGIRYIQAPLAYPRERKRRMNGGDDWLPLCVYDSSRGGVLTSENRCHWSDYYKTHAREPENFEFAPWVANLWKPIRKPAGDA